MLFDTYSSLSYGSLIIYALCSILLPTLAIELLVILIIGKERKGGGRNKS